MLMRAKVPKAGSVLLSGVVIGLIEFLIGAGWAVAVGFIAGAVIAELLARIGHYKSFWLNTIGYSVYMMFFALGTYLPMVIMTGYVDDMSTSNGVSAEYLTELHSFMNGTMVVIIAVVTFVAKLQRMTLECMLHILIQVVPRLAKKRVSRIQQECLDVCLMESSTVVTDRTSWRNLQNTPVFRSGMV